MSAPGSPVGPVGVSSPERVATPVVAADLDISGVEPHNPAATTAGGPGGALAALVLLDAGSNCDGDGGLFGPAGPGHLPPARSTPRATPSKAGHSPNGRPHPPELGAASGTPPPAMGRYQRSSSFGSMPALQESTVDPQSHPLSPAAAGLDEDMLPSQYGSFSAPRRKPRHTINIQPFEMDDTYRHPVRAEEEEDGYGKGLPKDEIKSPTEEQKEEQNAMFGMHKWKGHLTRRPLSERSEVVRELYKEPTRIQPPEKKAWFVTPGNVAYGLFFGWWLALLYFGVGTIMWLSVVGQDYARFAWDLGDYFFWPFGKIVVRELGELEAPYSEDSPLILTSAADQYRERQAKRSQTCTGTRAPFAFAVWCVCLPILWLGHTLALFFCSFLVIFMPMAKIHLRTLKTLLYFDPASVKIHPASGRLGPTAGTDIVFCTFSGCNIYYYKYSVSGMNIVLVNLLVFVLMSLLFGWIEPFKSYVSPTTIFVMSLLSVIPLSYYIGMAIASISAQSTHAVGAALNATFGSIVELLLYYTAMTKNLGTLVNAALTGSLLATILFIPGICMVIGGLKFKEQKFNLRSAGVSSSLLFVSVAGAYSPSIFQRAYGHHDLTCAGCLNASAPGYTLVTDGSVLSCGMCQFTQVKPLDDPHYRHKTLPLVYICSALLPIAYIVGLIFTLRTHKHIYAKAKDDPDDKHHAPHWTRLQAGLILLFATGLMALVAELLVANIEEVIGGAGISEIFIGATVFALVPDIAEIVNGVQFALQNNISLSIEVGTSIAVQICLIQMPALVLLTHFFTNREDQKFTLIFNDIYIWSVLFSVLVMNYTFMDGKSDYFQGSTLVIVYVMLMTIMFFTPVDTA